MFPKGSSRKGKSKSKKGENAEGEPRIYESDEHSITLGDIDPDALKIMARLRRAGHKAYVVGGGVRDILLGKRPKDFDLVTDATPYEIKGLFRNSRVNHASGAACVDLR